MPLPQTRSTLPLAAFLLLASPSYGNHDTSDHQPVVEIFMPPLLDRALNQTLAPAREIVRAVYAEIGVQVVWRSSTPPLSNCGQSSGYRRVVFAFERGYPRSAAAFAFAKPYEQNRPCVVLFVDRLQDEAKRNPAATRILLGHVLAHEIGHVLQRIARHTESGIMKASWTARDLLEMRASRLRFTEYDAALIHDALKTAPLLAEGTTE